MSMKSMKSNNHQSTLQSKRSEALTWAKEMMINESKQMNKKFSLFLLLLKLSNGSIRKKWKQENEESVFFLFNDYKQSAASCWLPKKNTYIYRKSHQHLRIHLINKISRSVTVFNFFLLLLVNVVDRMLRSNFQSNTRRSEFYKKREWGKKKFINLMNFQRERERKLKIE